MTEMEKFLSEVEGFIEDKKLTPTNFGRRFAGDPLFVFQLREGREPRTQTRIRVLDAMKSYQAAHDAQHDDRAAIAAA